MTDITTSANEFSELARETRERRITRLSVRKLKQAGRAMNNAIRARRIERLKASINFYGKRVARTRREGARGWNTPGAGFQRGGLIPRALARYCRTICDLYFAPRQYFRALAVGSCEIIIAPTAEASGRLVVV